MNCEIFESKILEYLDGELSQEERECLLEHIAKCENCSELLTRCQNQKQLFERYYASAVNAALGVPKPNLVTPQKTLIYSSKMLSLYAAAAAIGFVILVSISFFLYTQFIQNKTGKTIGIAENVIGRAQYFKDNKLLPLKEGMAITSNMRLKTTKDAYLSVLLPSLKQSSGDKNIIEFKDNSVCTFIAYDAQTILSLERGEVWAHIHQKMENPFIIKTSQFSIYDRGTIFNVAENLTGVSICVLQGKVEFELNGEKKVVEPLQYFATFDDKSNDSIPRHIEWSHYKEKLLAYLPKEEKKTLLESVRSARSITPKAASPQIPKDEKLGTLTSTQLLPFNTRFFLEIGNMKEIIRDWEASDLNRLFRDPALLNQLSGTMEEERNKAFNELGIPKWLNLIRTINGSVSLGMTPKNTPLIIADCRTDVDGIKNILKNEIQPLLDKWKAKKIGINDLPEINFKKGYLIIGLDDELVKQTIAAIDKDTPTTFTQTQFYKNIQANAPHSRLTIAYDFASTIKSLMAGNDTHLNKFLERSGFEGLDYIVCSPDFAGKGINQAFHIAFDGERFGVMNWIDEPSTMGSLFCFTPDTHLLFAARIKNPQSMIEDIMAWQYEDYGEMYVTNHQENIKLIEDFASCFGNEVAVALENPILPIPNIQAAIEIVDIDKFDNLLLKVVGTDTNVETSNYRDMLIVTLSRSGWKCDISYTVLGDFLVIGPGEPFLRRSIDIFLDKHSLMDEYAFKSLLPDTGQPNFSLLFYQNVAQCISWMLDQYFIKQISKQAQPIVPDISLLKNQSTPGIGYALSSNKYIDFYINGSRGVNSINFDEAMPIVSSLITPKLFGDDIQSKVATTWERLSVTATAIESYFVDNKYYPKSLEELLKPIRYISEVPKDPFSKSGNDSLKYVINYSNNSYSIYSVGPDGIDNSYAIIYDPTNGTQSAGDIVYTNAKK